NYSRNYLHGLMELESLSHACNQNLLRVQVPALIVQAKGDPVVNPVSAKIIHASIRSQRKELEYVDSDRHIIILREGSEALFARIATFLVTLRNPDS
ncbi:MAG: alpha/beta hydrolase, partial [Planctomycetes bacterium]|nr:alpha/beta hydrolase [Planctomycetota bacterium]